MVIRYSKRKDQPGRVVNPACGPLYDHHIKQSMDQPGKVANPARGQLNREMNIPLSPCVPTGEMDFSLSSFAPKNLVWRDGFDSPVPCQSAHLHTQAESGAYLRDSSRVPRRRPFVYFCCVALVDRVV